MSLPSSFEVPAARKKPAHRRNLYAPAVTILLVFSGLLNIALARRIRNMNVAILRVKAELKFARGLNQGDKAPPIRARDINGQVRTVTFLDDDRPTVVYIFAPACLWCSRNVQNVRALAIATASRYRFLGLSLSTNGLKELVSQYRIDFPTYSEAIGDSALAYNGGTPRTLVVSSRGVILKNWFGAYTGNLQREVEEYFNVRLPGVEPTQGKDTATSDNQCETCDGESASAQPSGETSALR
jgi:hypothetical protein